MINKLKRPGRLVTYCDAGLCEMITILFEESIQGSCDFPIEFEQLYECVGDVPNVVFPCAALTDAPTGRIAIYYGAADTVTGLAFTQVDDLIAFVKANSEL